MRDTTSTSSPKRLQRISDLHIELLQANCTMLHDDDKNNITNVQNHIFS